MVRRWFAATALAEIGIMLVLGAAGIQGYAIYGDWQHARQAGPGPSRAHKRGLAVQAARPTR
jgi:hypothetical protein